MIISELVVILECVVICMESTKILERISDYSAKSNPFVKIKSILNRLHSAKSNPFFKIMSILNRVHSIESIPFCRMDLIQNGDNSREWTQFHGMHMILQNDQLFPSESLFITCEQLIIRQNRSISELLSILQNHHQFRKNGYYFSECKQRESMISIPNRLHFVNDLHALNLKY